MGSQFSWENVWFATRRSGIRVPSVPPFNNHKFKRGDIIALVYKITNDVNDKVYIGATHFSLDKRWKEHLRDSKKSSECNRPLYKAINEFGACHFNIFPIENCSDDILYEREKYWVEYYDAFNNGYNATYGGTGKLCVDYQKIVDIYLNVKNEDTVAQILGVDKGTVRTALRENNVEIASSGEVKRNNNQKRIQMNSINGERIALFDSVYDAAQFISDTYSEKSFQSALIHIIEVCRGLRKTAYKYKWCFA